MWFGKDEGREVLNERGFAAEQRGIRVEDLSERGGNKCTFAKIPANVLKC